MLGEFIAAKRAERGWTRDEFAERAGLSSSMVEALERGEALRATGHVLASLAAALALPIEDLERAAGPPEAHRWPRGDETGLGAAP
ncbi:MAG TPA: helix-turn-helix domain-containing protein [Vicinamibacteria bacterium]